AGARVAVDAHKRNPADFVLWKQSSPEEPGWESPWGRGRPGWHIECSAMSAAYLGDIFDIHGGGLDLIFPHHENEIAQSRCAHGTPVMANTWMHNGFLQVEGRKMAKSDGNFVTIHELLRTEKFGGRKWPGEVLRLAMLMTHYREPIDFSVRKLEEAENILTKLRRKANNSAAGVLDPSFVEALSDDLDLPQYIRLLNVAELSEPTLVAAANLIGIDLSAEAAQLGGGTLRRVRAAFDVADGVVVVREAHALLPGDATLRMTGRILPPDAPPAGVRFDGTASVWAPALRTTLAWAAQGKAGAGERLPALVLRSAQVSGHVVADAGQVSVDQLRGALDGGAVSGALSVRLGARPQVQARLSLDRLDLDPWLPTQLPTPAALTARLGGVQAELKVEARQALLRGVTLAPLSLDLGIDMGRLALRQLDFKADGVRGTLSGTLLDGGRIADGRLDLHADAATPLARLLPDWVPGWLPGLSAALHGGPTEGAMLATLLHAPLWRSPAGLQVQASGTAEAMNLRLAGEVGDLKLDAQPTLDLSGPAWRWTGPVTLRHPGAPRLAASLGLAAAPGWLGDGSLSLVAQVTADPARVAVDSFNLTAGGLHATGALSLDRAAAGGPMLAGRVAADTLPLPLPAPQAADPLPLAALTGWQASVRLEAAHVLAGNTPVLDRLATTVSLSGGTLRLEGLTAQLGGGELSGTASLDGQANPPVLAAQASLTGAMLAGPLLDDPFDLTAGTVDASATLAASGFSPAGLLSSLSGSLRLLVRDGALAGVDLAHLAAALRGGDMDDKTADKAVRAALSGGSMGFDRLEVAGSLARGDLRFDQARLHAPSGTIDITGGLNLPDLSADVRLALHPAVQSPPDPPMPDPPTLGLRVTGKLAAPLRAPELADLIRWRAARRK
ncbi:MAG: AsmA family protein, partial [Rhodospirillales bacterium]|nr:AsmA family protein [Rhodospirillales bacterium]